MDTLARGDISTPSFLGAATFTAAAATPRASLDTPATKKATSRATDIGGRKRRYL